MGCKLLEIMADGLYAVFHRFEAFLKEKVDAQVSGYWMAIQRPSCFFNLCSSCSSRSNKRRVSCLSWPAVMPRRPHHPLLLPPLARPSLHSTHPHPPVILRRWQRSRTSEPSYSSPHGHPLSRLPRLRVVPFLGFAVVHHRGALGAARSMWSTTEFHLKNTVRGEADSWVHGSHKEVRPYYAQNNYSST